MVFKIGPARPRPSLRAVWGLIRPSNALCGPHHSMSAPLSDHGVSAPRPDRLRSSLTRPKHAELLTWHILRAARDADVPIKIFANEDPEEVVIAFCAEHMATTTTPGSGVIQHGSVPFPHLRTARPRVPSSGSFASWAGSTRMGLRICCPVLLRSLHWGSR